MSEKFEEGDVVQLKSGSPDMTISTVERNENSGRLYARCAWFLNGEVRREEFHVKVLVKIEG